MSAYLDIEVYADREADLEALFAELAAENGDELPPVIQDELPTQNFRGEAA